MPEAEKQCSLKFNMSESFDSTLSYFLIYEEFPPGLEDKKCYFECLFKAVDMLDSNSVPNKTKFIGAHERDRRAGLDNSSVEVLAFIADKCLPPKDLSSPCNIASNFMLCWFKVLTVLNPDISLDSDVKSINISEVYSKKIQPIANYCENMEKFGLLK
ncbi:hypothetical protein V9T40_011191 [Parthenolecanium corni]|uniref:Uncharacterized protein n=1 Tax=Parthenolecanium corni TaxID=536013 RepID=A0AAN9XZB6_9HEMI